MDNEVNNFIDMMYHAHVDNDKSEYYSKRSSSNTGYKSINPLTSFVFEYFIFNSIYQIDWNLTVESGELEYHDRYDENTNEIKQQRAMIKFIKNNITLEIDLFHSFKSIKSAT